MCRNSKLRKYGSQKKIKKQNPTTNIPNNSSKPKHKPRDNK